MDGHWILVGDQQIVNLDRIISFDLRSSSAKYRHCDINLIKLVFYSHCIGINYFVVNYIMLHKITLLIWMERLNYHSYIGWYMRCANWWIILTFKYELMGERIQKKVLTFRFQSLYELFLETAIYEYDVRLICIPTCFCWNQFAAANHIRFYWWPQKTFATTYF